MTSFNEVIDLALVTIRDYKLDNLIVQDEQAFYDYMDGFLIKSIPKFTKCLNSLAYDLELRQFEADLTNKEKDILSDIMVESWLRGEVQNVTQINLHISNREFRTFSEAQNLKEKSDYLNALRVKYNQDMTDYEIENITKLPFFGGM